MIDRIDSDALRTPFLCIAAGTLCALAGFWLDVGTPLVLEEPAKWGGFGALVGASTALMAVFGRRSTRR